MLLIRLCARWSTVSAVWNKLRTTARGSLLLCLLAGAVFSLPYGWEAAYPATYASLLGLFLLLQTDPLKTMPFRTCFCFCLGYLLPLYTWFAALYPFSALGYSRAAAFGLVALCCLGIPLVQAAVQAGVLQFGRFLPRGTAGSAPFLRAIGYGALWVLSETLLSFGELGLPWGTVALSQTGCTLLLPTVSLFGAKWLAFFAVTVCALLAHALLSGRISLMVSGTSLFLAAALCGGILLAVPSGDPTCISVAAVQGNISTDQKWQGETLLQVFETYARLTKEAAAHGAKLILLPESAVPVHFEEGGVLHRTYAAIASKYNCTIVTGVLRQQEDGEHNSLLAIAPDGSISNVYDKQHPVPFGEFIPLEPLLSRLFPAIGSLNLNQKLVTGDTDAWISTTDYTIGCMICYDSIFSSEALAGADVNFCVIATNDAWFGKSAGVHQHLRYASLRAAETGKAILRAGNTGISALIDRMGRRLAQTEIGTETILYGSLPVDDRQASGQKTLFGKTGDLVFPLCALFLLLVLPIERIRQVRQNKHPKNPG